MNGQNRKKDLHVLLLTCRQSPSRINYYNALGQLCDLTVVAERETPAKILRDYHVKPSTYHIILLKGIPMFGYMAFCPGIISILKKHKDYDVIVVEQYATPTAILAIWYMSRRNIPFVLSADGGFVDENEKNYKYRFKQSLISKASLWITGGKSSRGYLAHYGADPSKVKIFKFSPYNTSDLPDHMISPGEKKRIREELNIQEEIMIVSAGQQIHRKGFDILLRAFDQIEREKYNVGLYILGGEPNEECRNILDAMDEKNIHFPGLVPKEKLKRYYAASDLFVFPTRYDIWGYPVNEAMSFGLPVITTNQCNAGLELIEEGINGYLVEKEDVDGLYHAMVKLLEDDGKRADMGNKNFIKSKNYTSESMADSVCDILKEYCSKQGKD